MSGVRRAQACIRCGAATMSALNLPLCESCDGSNARAIAATYRAASHAPGPWKLHFWSENVGVGSDRPKARECESIAVVPRGPETGNQAARATADANARLISAAPELLAACEAAVAVHDSFVFRRRANTGNKSDPDPEYIAAARAAIAKARGGA